MECKRCHKEFDDTLNKHLHGYCSYTCRNTKERVCSICGKVFLGQSKTCSKECSAKMRIQTNLEKYGTANVSSSNAIKNKRKQTNLERYGVQFASQSEEKKEKARQTNLERYGVDNPAKVKEYIMKAKQTSKERYGVEHFSKLTSVRDQKCDKMKDLWSSEEYQKKHEQACLDKLGTTSPWSSREVIEKRKQNNIDKYGTDSIFKTEEFKNHTRELNIERYGVTNYMKTEECLNKVIGTNLKKYGVPYHCMTDACRNSQGNTISKINKYVGNMLGIYEKDYEFNIGKYSYDLKKGNTLIEVDPAYTHNSTVAPYFKGHEGKPLDKYYHQKKTEVALKEGYRCIHIFDWDDLDKIEAMLKDKETLYARNLVLKEVPEDLCSTFLNENHLQNTCKGQTIRLGLYKDQELIEVMTFGKPRYNKNYEYELLRLCTLSNYKVVGGAERLFKHFVSSYNPESIISYCNNSKFNGDVYKRLGFTLKSFGTPSCHWYNLKTKKHITDNLLRQRGFSQLHGDSNYEKASRGASNRDLMIEEGYVEVYDCGQSIYVWK